MKLESPLPSITPTPLRIVGLAPNTWDGPWMNRQHLLSRLASEHAIVYSNGPWHAWQRHSIAYRESTLLGDFKEQDGVAVDHPARLLLRLPRWPAYDRMTIRASCMRWRKRLAGYPGPLVAHVFHPEYLPFLESLRPDYVVYHAYDLFRSMGEGAESLEIPENRLLELADLVIATSAETARDFRTRTPRHLHVLGNGVDWSRFVRKTHPGLPPEFAGIPEPRIGYVGAINQKLDLGLLLELSIRQPRWQFVMAGSIGSVMPGDKELIARLRERPNLHFLGGIDPQRIPQIMLHLQVGLIPYRGLDWTMAGYPLKMLEYLACGMPVVASNLHAVREFEAVIAIADNVDEWERRVGEAVEGRARGTPESRLAVAKANSWDRRAAELMLLLQEMVAGSSATEQGATWHSRTRLESP